MLQILLGIVLLGGDFILTKLGIQPPRIYTLLTSNKMIAGIAIFFGGNFLKGYITRTRAFEIYINNELISSVLNTGVIMPIKKLATEVERIFTAN